MTNAGPAPDAVTGDIVDPANAGFDLGRPLYRQGDGTGQGNTDVLVQLDVFAGSLSDLIAAARQKVVDVRTVETRLVTEQVLDRDRTLPPGQMEDRITPIGSAAELVGLKASALGADRKPSVPDLAAERDREWHLRRAALRQAARLLDTRDVKGRDIFAARRSGKVGGARQLREQTPDALRETWDALVTAATARGEGSYRQRPSVTVPLTEAEARATLDQAIGAQTGQAVSVDLRELAGHLARDRGLPAARIEGVLTLAAVYAAASGDVALTQDAQGGPLKVRQP